MIQFKFLGTRIIKTGLAIFLTAWICQLLGWPPVFAVITAIVTLEPTVVDSIKKGLIRFPASAIGSAYAVLFITLFGDSPLTYTLAAVLTIVTCYRLKLHAGLLVATITAVAMIEVVYDNYLLSFFIRLGTTSIGIFVSTIVNMFILPPNYVKDIHENINDIYRTIGRSLHNILPQAKHDIATNTIDDIDRKIKTTEGLIRYQKDEVKFHPLEGSKKREFLLFEKQINKLHLMHYHLSKINELSFNDMSFNEEERKIVERALVDVANQMLNDEEICVEQHEVNLKLLMEKFWRSHNIVDKTDEAVTLPPVLILLYELVSFYEIIMNFNHIKHLDS